MKLKNTITDFIETTTGGFIYCPACGSSMSLEREGSYEMMLTFNARNEINDYISHYRQFLSKIDRAVEIRNRSENEKVNLEFPNSLSQKKKASQLNRTKTQLDNGLYHAADFTNILYDTLDLNYITRIINDMATFKDFENLKKGDQSLDDKFFKVFEFVNEIIDHDLVFTPFTSLIFDQDDVREWKKSNLIHISEEGKIEGELIELFVEPDEIKTGNESDGIRTGSSFFKYMKLVAENAKAYVSQNNRNQNNHNLNNQNKAEKTKNDIVEKIYNNIIRGTYLMVLLFGHESNKKYKDILKGVIEFKGQNGDETAIPFDLPRSVFVTPERLDEILRSYAVINLHERFNLELEFIEKIKAKTNDLTFNTTETTLKDITDDIKQYSQIVNFTCRGSLTTSEEINPNVKKGNDEPRDHSQYCGWYPKEEPTHSVVLIGSPGTSKSTIMLTGLTQFRRSAPTLSLNVTPTTSEELRRAVCYQRDFWNGYLPQPTKENERLSIQLKVETTYKVKEDFQRLYFVFTDIPGETAVRSLRDLNKETHPFILNILHNTETIVFLYDFSVDPNIRSQILNGPAHKINNMWDHYDKSFKQTSKERGSNGDSQEASNLKEIPTVDIPQHDLLMKIIDDLKNVRKDISGISFVCIIPKFDLYVNDGRIQDTSYGKEKEKIKFMSDFYEFLRTEKLITETFYNNDEDGHEFAYSSCAGRESQWIVDAENAKRRIVSQITIARAISDKARESLKRIGNALGKVDSNGNITYTGELSDAIEIGLIQTLEENFGMENVYLLPVSAQGEHVDKPITDKEQATKYHIQHPPHQKLTEYAFILPVVSAFKKLDDSAEW